MAKFVKYYQKLLPHELLCEYMYVNEPRDRYCYCQGVSGMVVLLDNVSSIQVKDMFTWLLITVKYMYVNF